MKPGGVKVSSSPGKEKFLAALSALPRLLYGMAVFSRPHHRSTSASGRSSPMFVSRSKSRGCSSTSAAVVTEEGEPSSPKVTCIGQVRIRNKRKPPTSNKQQSKLSSCASLRCLRCTCFLIKLVGICNKPPSKGGRRRPLWGRWACIRSGKRGNCNQRKADLPPQPPQELVTFPTKVSDREEDENMKEKEEEAGAHVEEKKASPPKNALLLMRCRSAPHNRASSLAAARFEVPLLPSPDVPGARTQEEVKQEQKERDQEQRRSSNAGGTELTQGSEAEAEAVEESNEGKVWGSRRLLVLTRSKSESARSTAEKLSSPEVSSFFWQRRPSPACEKNPCCMHERAGAGSRGICSFQSRVRDGSRRSDNDVAENSIRGEEQCMSSVHLEKSKVRSPDGLLRWPSGHDMRDTFLSSAINDLPSPSAEGNGKTDSG